MSIRGFPFFIRGNLSCAGHRPRVRNTILSGRSSDSRIILPAAPSRRSATISGFFAAFVPGYSGGPVPDSHGVPFEAHFEHLSDSAYSYRTCGVCQAIFNAPLKACRPCNHDAPFSLKEHIVGTSREQPGSFAPHADAWARVPGDRCGCLWRSFPPSGQIIRRHDDGFRWKDENIHSI